MDRFLDEQNEYSAQKAVFHQLARRAMTKNAELSNIDIARTLGQRVFVDEKQIRREMWQAALGAMRLQRTYRFPAWIVAHVRGPPGYLDLPLYQIPLQDSDAQ